MSIHPSVRIHPTAIIEDNVSIDAGSSVWDNVHIRKDTRIGKNCIIGEKTYIAYGVNIGSGVKINAFVYICAGVTIEDQVMIAAGTIFTNDRFPRAFAADGSLMTSAPTEDTLETTVRRGVTIGAACTIGPGIVLGAYAMIGMGSVVTRHVSPYNLVYGNPARSQGLVCRCGEPLPGTKQALPSPAAHLTCVRCAQRFRIAGSWHPETGFTGPQLEEVE